MQAPPGEITRHNARFGPMVERLISRMARYKPGYGMTTDERIDERVISSYFVCKICEKGYRDRTDLIEHLRTEHEILELASYTANTMAAEQERDKIAGEFRRRFELLKRQLAGHEAER
jgi:hypothetical protein